VKSRVILACVAVGLFLAIVAIGGNRTASGTGETPVATTGVAGGESDRAARQSAAAGGDAAEAPAGPNPVVVVETSKGRFEFELYQQDAPRSVAHILALVKRGFYDGMRVHRVEAEFVVQFGDPSSRDLDRKSQWGRGGSGRAIGAVEISPQHTHDVGAVGLAYAAHPSLADSQLYVILADTERSRKLDGEFAVIGQVIAGMDVVQKIEMLDTVNTVTVRP
jgi:cyclophilin family peptidyl-prolyl cis-trans isomerase